MEMNLVVPDDIIFRKSNQHIYHDNMVMNAIFEVQKTEFEKLHKSFVITFLNNFIETADLETIMKWEDLLDITPNPNDTLDVRRQQILNITSAVVSITRLYAIQRIESIFPNVDYRFEVDNDNYTIFFDISTNSREWADSFRLFVEYMEEVKPANMIFKPRLLQPNTHSYLSQYTYGELEPRTYGDLSQYANS